MISLRLAVSAVLAAAIVARCFTYWVTSPSAQVEADQRLPPTGLKSRDPGATASTSFDPNPTADEKAAAAVASGALQAARYPSLARTTFKSAKALP